MQTRVFLSRVDIMIINRVALYYEEMEGRALRIRYQ